MAVAGYTLIKFFRGSSAEVQSVIPEQGEPLVDLDKKRLYIGDGVTTGGRFVGPFEPGLLGFQKKTASSNTNANSWQIINVKTAGGAVDLTLPTAPSIGDQIRIVDGSRNFNVTDCTLLRNGNRINSIESNLDLTTVGQYILYYGNDGTNNTWFVFPIIGERWYDQGIERDNWNVKGKTAAYTAQNNDSILCNTIGGGFTITTPASPELGYAFQVQDWKNNFATSNITIAPNGSQTIGGLASSLVLSEDDQIVTLMYDIDSTGAFTWRVKYGRDNNDIIGGASDVKNSIEIDVGALQLVGDENAPGADKYYGTNSGGIKGFYDISSGSGDLTATADSYADLVGSSSYMNCTYDNFLDQTKVNTGSSTMTYNSGNDRYDFTTGQILESNNLYDPLLSNTVDECMVHINYSGTGILQVSADGGSNWETTSNNEIHTFTNTGTDIRIKFTASSSGSIYDWGVLYIPDTSVYSAASITGNQTKVITDYDASRTVTTDDSNKGLTNATATGTITFTLDENIAIGSHFIFIKSEGSQDLIVSVPTGQYIADSTSGGQIINDTDGQASASITLLKVSSIMYSIIGGWGTWTTS